MKISYQWLKEFVDLKISAQELPEKLINLGLGVEGFQDLGEDLIFDIEITSNRGDALSIIGIAREIASCLNIALNLPKIKISEDGGKIEGFLKVEIRDKYLCPRYTARMIKGVKIGPSPLWMSKRLESLGIRSINNVVDATNYVLLERGQPIHAFDYSLIKGRKIIVRRANQDEKLVTLDGIERKIDEDMLVIADNERAIALAGIMGGANTEVNDATKDIVIESACFNAASIRKTSQKLGLGTSASYRFERSSDIIEARTSSDRVCSLMKEIAGGTIIKGIIDEYPLKRKSAKIRVRFKRIKEILGMDVSRKEIVRILKHLGFDVRAEKVSLKIGIPSWRDADITREIDVIEEIARLHGYGSVKPVLPALNFAESRLSGREEDSKYASVGSGSLIIQEEARIAMKDAGFFEAVNYGIMKRGVFESLLADVGDLVKISNPLDEEMDAMRPSLIPWLTENLSFNFNRDTESVKIFEIGRVFKKSTEKLPEENIMFAGLISGYAHKFWDETPRKMGFYDLKGAVEYLLERLDINNFNFEPGKSILADTGVKVLVGNEEIGFTGQLSDKIVKSYKLPGEVYFFEVNLESIKKLRSVDREYKAFSKFPAVQRDIALLVPVGASAKEVENLLRKEGGEKLTKILFFDYYQGEQVPRGYKSLAFNLVYQSMERTLTDEEVNDLHFRIIQRLSERGIKLRE